MFLNSLINLTPEFPRDIEALSRLDSLLTKDDGRGSLFTLANLYETANFSSQYVFNYVLDRLIQDGILKKVVRVETALGGIDDFPDIEDVPEEIHDWRIGETIAVKPEFIKILFKNELK
jgi:hypothetical protein